MSDSVVAFEPTNPSRPIMRSATAARACATASVPCAPIICWAMRSAVDQTSGW